MNKFKGDSITFFEKLISYGGVCSSFTSDSCNDCRNWVQSTELFSFKRLEELKHESICISKLSKLDGHTTYSRRIEVAKKCLDFLKKKDPIRFFSDEPNITLNQNY